jgi:non-specific serine/threonine protein kinase
MFSAQLIARKESQTIQTRGLSYQSRVKIVQRSPGEIVAKVYGSRIYTTVIAKAGKNYVDTCNCPYGATCKHTIALAYIIEKDPELCKLIDSIVSTEKIIQEKKSLTIHDWLTEVTQADNKKTETQRNDGVYYQLGIEKNSEDKQDYFILIIRAGKYKINKSRSITFYNPQSPLSVLQRNSAYITPLDQKILQIISNCLQDNSYSFFTRSIEDHIHLDRFALEELRRLLPKTKFLLNENGKPVSIFPETVDFSLQAILVNNGITWKPILLHQQLPLSHQKIINTFDYDPPVILTEDNTLYFLSEKINPSRLTKMLQSPDIPAKELKNPAIKLHLLTASELIPITLPPEWEQTALTGEMKPAVLLDTSQVPITLDLFFNYNGRRFHALDNKKLYNQNIDLYKRNIQAEKEIMQTFASLLSMPEIKTLPYQLSSNDFKKLFNEIIQKIPISWDLLLNKPEQKIERTNKSISLEQSSSIDWLDISGNVSFDETTLPLVEILDQIMDDIPMIEVKNKFYFFDKETTAKLKKLQEVYDGKSKTIRLHRTQLGSLDDLKDIINKENLHDSWKKSMTALRSFTHLKTAPMPKKFNAKLRPYQQKGTDWLHFLRDFHFGGILADDMGLGKTLQTLTILAKTHETEKKPSLIIAPTSVVHNWKEEIEKFTPSLNSHLYVGKDRKFPKKADVILTSYAILWRDKEKLAKQLFHYVILDEAQYIKNHSAQTAQAARNLQSDYRLSLTGTPIENNLNELWSQFAFVNPGMFGSLEQFKQQFVTPIEKNDSTHTKQRLQKLIKPFVLRRTKKHVLKELPEKIEQTIWCEMGTDQTQLYEALKKYYQVKVFSLIDSQGIEKSHIQILEALLRLRQACCHPQLLKLHEKKSFANLPKSLQNIKTSVKFDETLELIKTAIAEKHKILVFSQFTSMLAIFAQELQKQGIKFVQLTGETKDRKTVIDQFQNNPDYSLFLLSLKAGGIGLNLTSADYVIHYDPWWNPAVEQQATDRAHRIGQNKVVSVYKMLIKNSIEEKIQMLQEKKKDLIENIIGGNAKAGKLTKEDIMFLFAQ